MDQQDLIVVLDQTSVVGRFVGFCNSISNELYRYIDLNVSCRGGDEEHLLPVAHAGIDANSTTGHPYEVA